MENPTHKVIDTATRELVDHLLLERIARADIAWVVQVSEQWLQDYVNTKATRTPRQAAVDIKGNKQRGLAGISCPTPSMASAVNELVERYGCSKPESQQDCKSDVIDTSSLVTAHT